MFGPVRTNPIVWTVRTSLITWTVHFEINVLDRLGRSDHPNVPIPFEPSDFDSTVWIVWAVRPSERNLSFGPSDFDSTARIGWAVRTIRTSLSLDHPI